MKKSIHINPDWQRMREDGMMIKEIADITGHSMGHIVHHTVTPRGKRVSMTARVRIIEWYNDGLKLPEIARNARLPKAVCERIIRQAIEQGTASPRQAGCPTRRLQSADASDIPDVTELLKQDGCPGRVLRGLTAEQYKRLIEVNREYDKRKERDEDGDRADRR